MPDIDATVAHAILNAQRTLAGDVSLAFTIGRWLFPPTATD